MMARNVLRSDAVRLLREQLNAEVTIVSRSASDGPLVAPYGGRWVPYYHPWRSRSGRSSIGGWLDAIGGYARHLAGLVVHMMLTFRLNTISEFSGFQVRLRQSWRMRKVYLREGLPMSHAFGIPFPRAVRLYEWLRRLYYSDWQSFSTVNGLVSDLRPDLVILSMIQTHMVTPYALAAVRNRVPVLGINGSWDQPTTKGPLCPGIEKIVAQNSVVRDELIRYHKVPPDRIEVIGWLQMDPYVAQPLPTRAEILTKLGLGPDVRYVLFAANAPRLGMHEPYVLAELAVQFLAGEFGEDVVLVCRPHPLDKAWQHRLAGAARPPKVIVTPAEIGPLSTLAGILRHAEVVIASAGSINLDAIALDTPSIGLAWEAPELPYWDRPARSYDLDHLKELRSHPGMAIATNMYELSAGCKRYLADRSADKDGRAMLRARYLDRLDGRAAARLVEVVGAELQRLASVRSPQRVADAGRPQASRSARA